MLFSPYVTQRMPEHWGDDADQFRPARWLEGEPAPFTFIPFGGAYRKCIGFALALPALRVFRLGRVVYVLRASRAIRGLTLARVGWWVSGRLSHAKPAASPAPASRPRLTRPPPAYSSRPTPRPGPRPRRPRARPCRDRRGRGRCRCRRTR